ncbi:MAG: carboxypeptidase-like regulatory domain-containing protein, partial [Prevotellaceae bacterium]|nr:carboxypeptidase-like regulatory domain-containing protein [Prevotellaceae bacterium]
MKKIFYLTMAAALMCGCAEDAEDEKNTGSVHGVVNDKQTDDPISGATINIIDAQELEDAIKEFQQSAMDPNAGSYDFSYDDLPVLLSTTTGSDGAYSLEAVKAGKYYVFAKKNAYEENYIPATVEAGRNTKCDVILNRLSLRIIDNEKLGQDIDFLD